MWKTPFKNGKTYADCMPNGGKMIAGNYPMFDEAKGKVVTFENLINECRVKNGEEPYSYHDMKTMGVLTSYARTLSDGMKMNIKVDSPGALKAFDDGKKTYYTRTGQLNFACASCHVDNAGNRMRSEILSPSLGQAVHFPVFRGGSKLVTLQNRFVGCFKQVRQVPRQGRQHPLQQPGVFPVLHVERSAVAGITFSASKRASGMKNPGRAPGFFLHVLSIATNKYSNE